MFFRKDVKEDLVDVEAHVEEVDIVLAPAVFLQDFHQHRALLAFHLLLLRLLALVGAALLILIAIFLVLLIFLIRLVLLGENQLKLRVLPKGA